MTKRAKLRDVSHIHAALPQHAQKIEPYRLFAALAMCLSLAISVGPKVLS
jgi:hypothetical protein